MTQVQVNYWANQENKRHNFATERQAKAELVEERRHNLKIEGETNRHNLVTEGQGDRDLDIKEFAARENRRANKANEKIRRGELSVKRGELGVKRGELSERIRSDKANERIKRGELKIKKGDLDEKKRSNRKQEQLKKEQIDETRRANQAQERLKAQQLEQEYERIQSQISRNDMENALTSKRISRYDIEVLSKLGDAGKYVALFNMGIDEAKKYSKKVGSLLGDLKYNKTKGEYTYKGSTTKPSWVNDILDKLMKGIDAYDKRTGGVGKW